MSASEKRPACTSGTRAGQVLGMGAKIVRSVMLFKKTRPMGKAMSMFRLTPTTEMVPPVAAQLTASTMVASAPTASMTDSAPRPLVVSSTCR